MKKPIEEVMEKASKGPFNIDCSGCKWLNNGPKLLEACREMLEQGCFMCKSLNPHHENCTGCEDTDWIREAIKAASEVEVVS